MTSGVITEEQVPATSVPAPPPPPVQEEASDSFNPVRGRVLYKIWDLVAVYGPIKRTALFGKVQFQAGGSWRAYLRYHPKVHAKAYEKDDRLIDTANRWYFEREIGLGVERGFLAEDEAGLLTIGVCPPEHEALRTMGGEAGVLNMLEDRDQAMAILEHKVNYARRKPTRVGKNELRRSLERVGQLDPIWMWQPHGRSVDESIVVNGQTRLELCEELGIEPRVEWYERNTSATEILLHRIEFEVAATSKDQSREARDAYIALLAEQGVKPSKIAEELGLSRSRVTTILSQVSADEHLGQDTPSIELIEEWRALHGGGWTYRDIAEQTLWSKNTVQRYMQRAEEAEEADQETSEEGEPDPAVPPVKLPKHGTAARAMLDALGELGQATRTAAYTHAGLTYNQVAKLWTTWRNKGLIRVVGTAEDGKTAVCEITPRTAAALAADPAPPSPPVKRAAPPRKATTSKRARRSASKPTPEPPSEPEFEGDVEAARDVLAALIEHFGGATTLQDCLLKLG